MLYQTWPCRASLCDVARALAGDRQNKSLIFLEQMLEFRFTLS